jgi:hypothetical protein
VLNAHLSNVKIGYLDATTLGNIVIDRGSVIVSAALDKDSGTVTIRDSTVGNIAAGDGFTNVMLDNDIFGFNGETSTTCAITQLNSRQFSVTHSQFYCDVASGGFFNLNNDLPISNAVISGNNFWNTNGNISYGVGVGAPQSFTVLTVPTSLSVTYAQSNYRANGILIGNSLATTASGKQCVVSAEPIASSGSMLLTFTSCTATPVIGDVFKVNVIQSLTETSNSWTGVQGQMIVSAAGPYSLPVDRLYADSKDWVRIYNASNWPIPACSHTFTATTVGYGAEVTVGDSTSSTFGATYVPGGVNYEKVSCNGSHWVIY